MRALEEVVAARRPEYWMRLTPAVLLLALAACCVEPRVRLLPVPRDPARDLQLRVEPERHVYRHDEEIVLRLEIVNLGPRPLLVTELHFVDVRLPALSECVVLASQACVEVTPRQPVDRSGVEFQKY